MKSTFGKTLVGAFALVVLTTGASGVARAKARISRKRAEAIALKRQAGKINEGELEREQGRLIYSFDIQTADGGIMEVQVDAYSGKVVSATPETAAHEAQEKAADTKRP